MWLCCCGCDLGSDTFDGALTNWTQDGGTWSTSGGLLIHSTAGKITHNTAAGSAGSRVRVETFPSASGSTGVLRVYIAWYDDDNYLFGEINETANTIRLGQLAGGIERYLADAVSFTPAARPTVCLLWHPGTSLTQYETFTVRGAGRGQTVGSWTSPENITDDDGSYAEFIFSTIDETSDTLESDDYQFLLPSGATVTNITVGIRAQSGEATHEIVDKVVTLTIPNNTPGASSITFETKTVPFAEGNLSWEGTPAEWGYAAVPEPSDFNNIDFGANFQFLIGDDPDPPENLPMQVDFAAIELEFTTPPRTGGRLVLSYDGDCVSAFGVRAHESGLKSGLEVVSGTWDFTSYDYSYAESAARPTCPTCSCDVAPAPECECCAAGFPAAEQYIVDLTNFALGTGADEDNACPCGELDGEFAVDADGSCQWFYQGTLACTANGVATTVIYYIVLQLVDDGVGGCYWRVRVSGVGSGGQDPADPSQDGLFLNTTYTSSSIASDQDCQTMPVTLNKLVDEIGDFCTGTLPSTITIDSV